MNIDFIKFLVGYADGFGIREDGAIVSPAGFYYYHDKPICNIPGGFNGILSAQEMWVLDYYPLLLQRAIEGINIEATYHINIGYRVDKKYNSSAYLCVPPFTGKDYVNDEIDNAKIQPLEYVWEQRKT